MVKITFRKKFHLASSKPKNADADILFQAIRNEYENFVNSNSEESIQKSTRKCLKSIQKGLVEIPVGARVEVRYSNPEAGSQGFEILFRALPESRTLRVLALVRCGIHGELINTVANLLGDLHHLEELNLSGNNLFNPGVTAIVNSTSVHPTINTLKINSVSCSDDSGKPLKQWMRDTRTSLFLDLGKNNFSEKTIDQFIEVSKANIFVVTLNLEGSGINEEQLKTLTEILIKNEAIASVIDNLILNACRRTFKSKLISFRESVKENRSSDDLQTIEESAPAYKWLQKNRSSSFVSSDVPSQRFQVGVALDVGRRKEMQDVVCVRGSFRGDKNQDFIALFDGHGGREAATYGAERLHAILAEAFEKNGEDPITCIKDSFLRCHKEMSAWSTITGTTAVVVVIVDNKRYIANLGDSRAILCQKGSPVFTTIDHKVLNTEEQARVVHLGGQIIDGRVNGQLSITRALGDSNLYPFVIPLPDVYEQQISALDEFIVLASDGIWDVLTQEDVVKLIVNKLKKTSLRAPDVKEAKSLAELIKDEAYNRGSNDNISVIVILFNGFLKMRRKRKKTGNLTTEDIPRSPSLDSQISSKHSSDLEGLYTTSDSELPSMKGEEELEDEDEDENLSLSSRSRDPEKKPLALDDSVLQKLKQNESEKTPIPTSFALELMDVMGNL